MITVVVPCHACRGTGKYTYSQEQECPVCKGDGKQNILVGCIVTQELNFGDHGDMISRVADVSKYHDVTLRDFLAEVLIGENPNYQRIESVTFRTAYKTERNL